MLRYSSKFIFLLVQSLLVQSDDSDSNYFYQKLFATTHRPNAVPTSSFPGAYRSPVLDLNAFYERFYSKTQRTTLATVLYSIRSSRFNMSKKIEAYNITQEYNQHAADECSYYGGTFSK
jgi:hypothetical protein